MSLRLCTDGYVMNLDGEDVTVHPGVIATDDDPRVLARPDAWQPTEGGGAPEGAAGGDLGGDFPNPNVLKIHGHPVSAAEPDPGDVLTWGPETDEWVPRPPAAGATPGAAIVRGPFAIAFDDAALPDGVEFYTPTVGDLLLDAWFQVDTAWDAPAKADFGQFLDGNVQGVYGNYGAAPAELDGAAVALQGGIAFADGGQFASLRATLEVEGYGSLGYFTTDDPLLLVVSADGHKGGADPVAAQGAARFYIVTATPEAFS